MYRVQNIKQIPIFLSALLAVAAPQQIAGKGSSNIHQAYAAADDYPRGLFFVEKIVNSGKKHHSHAESSLEHTAPQYCRKNYESLPHTVYEPFFPHKKPETVKHYSTDNAGNH